MREITIFEWEEKFDEIMLDVENGEKYLIKTPDGNGIILTPTKDDSISIAESEGWISEYK